MGGLFSTMGSMLHGGFNVLGDSFHTIKKDVSQAGDFWASTFFPAAQKTTLVPSTVSNQPYTTYSGVPPTSQDAPTITPFYQNWWNKAKAAPGILFNKSKDFFMGEKIKDSSRSVISTLAKSGSKLLNTGMTHLADNFAQKWGMKSREYSGEKQGKAYIYYQNPTQSKAPATQPGLFDKFLNLMQWGNQPKGMYSIGFPQSAPVKTYAPNIDYPSKPGGLLTLPNILILSGIGFGLFYIIKKGKI